MDGLRGALRIRRPVEVHGAVEEAVVEAEPKEPEPKSADDYFQRLLKLLPSEIVGIYLIGRETANQHKAGPVWAAICFGLVLIFRAIATMPADGGQPWYKALRSVQWWPVLATAISFVIWVHAMGGHLPYFECFEAWMASLAVLVWGVFIPVVIKGAPADQG